MSAHIIDALLAQAARAPGQTAYIFVSDGHEEQRLTRAQLCERMRRIAASLLRHCAAGDRVALLLPQDGGYVQVFWACLYAGLVPVPLYPAANPAVRARLAGILADSGAVIAVCNEADAGADGPRQIGLDALLADAEPAAMAALAPDTLAYLQYSSGSTGAPKGVMISHANIIANLEMIAAAAGVGGDDVFVNWLPLHHDLGLVNTVLLPAAVGALSVIGTPLSFMRNPLSWLTRMARYGGTISGGPNFAYQAVLDRLRLRGARAAAVLADLDLRRWRVAFNAAEPIQVATLDAFTTAMQPAGFGAGAFFAAYGMAEATVFVCGAAWDREREAAAAARRAGEGVALARNATIACGPADDKVVVVDAAGHPAAPGVEGEIWIRGAHVSSGYFGQAGAAQPAFQRRTPDGDGPFFATGDSGAIEQGMLYVLGRIKDIIIQNGRNIHPSDVEQVAADVLAGDARYGACAAIGRRQGGTEAVLLVLEARASTPDDDGLMERIAARVFAERGVLLDAIVTVPQGGIGKTSSGKIRRQALRQALESGQLEARQFQAAGGDSGETPAADAELERQLAALLSSLADVPVDDPHRSFFAYGVSSLQLYQLVAELAQGLGIAVTIQDVFEHPTLRRLSNLIAAGASTAAPAPTGDRPALSANQRMILSIDAWAPGNPAYHLPLVLELGADTDPSRLARAASETLMRHEILRTVYGTGDGGEPRATVLPADGLRLTVEPLPAAAVPARLNELMQLPFDLARDLPVRGAVLTGTAGGPVLLALVLHHVAADGWSLRLLAEQILRRYHGGAPADDAAVAWSPRHPTAGSQQQALAYWRAALSDLPDVHSLPLDGARAPVRGLGPSGRHRIRLDAPLVDALKRLCAAEHATLFSGIHALLAIALARTGNHNDVVLGAFLSGRDAAEQQTRIGFLAQTTLLRTRLDLEADLAGTIGLCRDTLRDAHRHGALSYLDLLRELMPARDPGYNPLFQISLNYHDYGSAELPGGLAARRVELDAGVARYDLAVELYPENGGLRIDFDYDSTLFEAGSIARLAAFWQALLASALAAPATPVGRLPAHVQRVTPLPPSPPAGAGANGVSLYRRFHDVAAATPDAPAVRYQQESLSYGQLSAEASRVAAEIARHAVAGDRVLIFMHRTPRYVAAILAILQLDCTYVPLDPDYYQDALAERIGFIAPACLVVDAATQALLPVTGVPAILAPAADTPATAPAIPLCTPRGAHPAYILFTSGSTGSPKAVAMGHAALDNLITEISGSLGHAAPVVLNYSSIAFDMHFTEVFTALLNGGVVALADAAMRRNTLALLQLVAEQGVTLLNLSYPVLCELALGAEQAGLHLPALRVVLSTAQQLKITPGLRGFFLRHPNAALFNHYGPTETHVVTIAALGNAPATWPDVPTIGAPIRGTDCIVVNASGMPEAPGAIGELYVAGVALADGYYANPAMTAARFVELDAGGGRRVRAYRTGDFVRVRNDGTLQYLGRKDHELKIRGLRVDLSDIEASLQRCAGVAQAVVLARPLGGGMRIIAYVQPSPGAPVSGQGIAVELRRALPAYMVPDQVLLVEQFPLNQNAKIDVARLPLPTLAVPGPDQPAQSAHEAVVHAIWRKVLAHDGFGRATNFFEAGGDSLALMAVKRELDLHYGRDIDLVAIYGSPTVATLAALVEGTEAAMPGNVPRPRQNLNTVRRQRLAQARREAEDVRGK